MSNLETIIKKLNEAQYILAASAPDGMDITVWNQTPMGKALSCIIDALDILSEMEDE
jgi:hypothetical protein